MEALLKEKEVKEKRQKDLSEKEIPKAMEVLKQAEMQLEARQAKKSEKGLSPEQTVTVENSINEATDKTTRATVMMSALEKEAKAIADSLKSTHSATEIMIANRRWPKPSWNTKPTPSLGKRKKPSWATSRKS